MRPWVHHLTVIRAKLALSEDRKAPYPVTKTSIGVLEIRRRERARDRLAQAVDSAEGALRKLEQQEKAGRLSSEDEATREALVALLTAIADPALPIGGP